MERLIVTGGTGFIGSNLVRKLVSQNYDVHVICRKDSNLNSIWDCLSKIDIYKYDDNIKELINYFQNVKPICVFHLASLFIGHHKSDDVDNLIKSNIHFGAHILEAMAQSDTKQIINTGTSWQHYENEDYNPVCLYAATKEAFEKLLEYYVRARGFKAVTLKLFDTYGENDTRGKLINQLNKIAKEGTVLNMSKGEQKIDLVHVDDVVEAYIRALEYLKEKEGSFHEKYGAASQVPVTLRELIGIYEEATGNKLNINWGSREYREREVMVPWENYKLLPNWHGSISLEEGLKRLGKSE